MSDLGSFKVESFSIGNKGEREEIVFLSIEDMLMAYRELDNGKDILLEKDGKLTLVKNSLVSEKVYSGVLLLSAKKRG